MIYKSSGDTVIFRIKTPEIITGTIFISLRDDEDNIIFNKKQQFKETSTLELELSHNETKKLCGEYVFDIRVKEDNGKVSSPVMSDILTFQEPITTNLND